MSKQGHSIVKRTHANDIFLTPPELAKLHIDIVENLSGCKAGVWYDPFKNTGNYFNQYPKYEGIEHQWGELLEGRDFLTYDPGVVDCIVSNPPYSIMNEVIDKSIRLNPKFISYLIGNMNLTPLRIKKFNDAGYCLRHLHFCKIHEWFSTSFIVTFEKMKGNDISKFNCISFDCQVYHDENIIKQKACEKEAKKIAREVARDNKKMLKALEKAKRDFKVGDEVVYHIQHEGEIVPGYGKIVKINTRTAWIEATDGNGSFTKVSRKCIDSKL